MYVIIYYESFKGKPVVEFIINQFPKEQAKILREIDLLQNFGLSLGMPHIPHIRKVKNTELWELRIKHGNNIFRILFKDLDNNTYLLLHGFQKKQDKIPKREIDTALNRLKEYLERGDG